MPKNHREPRKSALTDWTVRDIRGNEALITRARFTRDEHGGYTFTDADGVTADFPPGTVLHVMRKEPGPAEAAADGDPGPIEISGALPALKQSGDPSAPWPLNLPAEPAEPARRVK